MNACELSFGNDMFELVIDKGTLDAIYCSGDMDNMKKAFQGKTSSIQVAVCIHSLPSSLLAWLF